MIQAPIYQLLCVVGSLAVAGCGSETAPQQTAPEWHQVSWSQGTIDVALIRPADEGSGPHPVIFALPWGSGSVQLVQTFVQSYWLVDPAARGYYVVAPAIRGSTLATTAGDIVPPIFEWMEDELTFDADRVALVGASNGGRGIFFAALAQPDRFRSMLGLPGSFTGDPADLTVLTGKPIRLLVGEFDDGWVTSAEATVAALASQGITAELDIVPGEGHVMALDPRWLLDWIDEALGR